RDRHRGGKGAAGVPPRGGRCGRYRGCPDDPLRAGASLRDRRHPPRRHDDGGRDPGAGGADACGHAQGHGAGPARARHRRRLARASAGGYDAMIRLGLALRGPTILYRGIWPTHIGTAFGVAAVAARLMRLDATQAAHALALALTVAAPGVGHHNAPTTTRWLAVGLAARNGLVAARAARAGFTSDLNLLDGKFFASVYDIQPAMAELTRGLGQHLPMLDLSFKAWCAARQTFAATQALTDILAR